MTAPSFIVAPPCAYLGVAVPEHIRAAWRRWEGMVWRQQAYRSTGRLDPPDERFNILAPDGLCALHLRYWLGERDRFFDPRSGNRWPGCHGSLFDPVGDLRRVLVERRVEWDEQASRQMQAIEAICLSGRSPQCRNAPATAGER